jgi:hypothetical protein
MVNSTFFFNRPTEIGRHPGGKRQSAAQLESGEANVHQGRRQVPYHHVSHHLGRRGNLIIQCCVLARKNETPGDLWLILVKMNPGKPVCFSRERKMLSSWFTLFNLTKTASKSAINNVN